VATALGYAKSRNALATHVDEEDKTTALIQGPGSNYKSKAVLINESGLNDQVLRPRDHAR
jgi:prophage antirepressor-like protein